MSKFIIGISGKIEVGKDLLGRLILLAIAEKRMGVEQTVDGTSRLHLLHPHLDNAQIRKFATALKGIVALLTGCSSINMEDQLFKQSVVPKQWWRTVKEAREWLTMKHFVQGSGQDTFVNLDDTEIAIKAKNEGFVFDRTYRDMLQEVGTTMRDYHINCWANTLVAGYDSDPHQRWIITDVRFPNEAQVIRERNGVLILLKSDKLVQPHHNPTHTSETALDKYDGWDLVVWNNGTIEDLYQHARFIVNQYNLE